MYVVSEILLLLFLIFYSIEETVEIIFLGKSHFKSLVNILDMVVIILGSLVLGYRAFIFLVMEPGLGELNIQSQNFIDFTTVAFWVYFFDCVLGILVFFAWVKLLKYISFNKAMITFSGTISRCIGDLVGFFVMFTIIYTAFVELGYLLFGAQVYDYSSLYNTMFTLLRIILGDFDFFIIEKANRYGNEK